MKFFTITTLFLLFFSACSYENAFSRFNISQEHAKSEENILSAKIYHDKDVVGVVSCVYLNAVIPQKYQDGEYFYVYLYSKKGTDALSFVLNNISAMKVKELDVNNEFINLTSSNVDWQRYYLVKFKTQGELLVFKTKIAQFTSSPMTFNKDNE